MTYSPKTKSVSFLQKHHITSHLVNISLRCPNVLSLRLYMHSILKASSHCFSKFNISASSGLIIRIDLSVKRASSDNYWILRSNGIVFLRVQLHLHHVRFELISKFRQQCPAAFRLDMLTLRGVVSEGDRGDVSPLRPICVPPTPYLCPPKI